MLPLHTFKIDFIDNTALPEEEFRELISLSLYHLEALAKALRSRSSFSVFYYPPQTFSYNTEGWCARCVLLISVGRDRIEPMLHLFDVVISQIECDLPPYIDIIDDVGRFDLVNS